MSSSWDPALTKAAAPFVISTMSVAAGAFVIACTASSSSITAPAALITVAALGALKGIHACGNEAHNLMKPVQGKEMKNIEKTSVDYFNNRVASYMIQHGAEALGTMLSGILSKRVNPILEKAFSG